MDWWSNSAFDPDDGNEFYCRNCLNEAYGPVNDQSVEQIQAADEEMDSLDIPKGAAVSSVDVDDLLGDLDDSPF